MSVFAGCCLFDYTSTTFLVFFSTFKVSWLFLVVFVLSLIIHVIAML